MRLANAALGTALVLSLTFSPAFAGPNGSKGPKVTKTSTGPKAPKTSTGPKTSGPTPAKGASTKPPKPAAGKSGVAKHSTSTTSTTSAKLTTTSPVDFQQGKVGELLNRNTALRSKLETQLRALGYTGTVYEAAYGFRNPGQFNAAVQNAQNHTLSFEQLKALMTGLSVDPTTHEVMRATVNPDGTMTKVPVDEATGPAPTQSLGQAKKTIAGLTETETVATTAGN
jgi:hypothetical protein